MDYAVVGLVCFAFGVYLTDRFYKAVVTDAEKIIEDQAKRIRFLHEQYFELGLEQAEEIDYYDLACMAGSMTPERRN